MATYFVSTLGDDANSGANYPNAKLTIPAGLALLAAKGDILNIVNDGVHDWPTSETSLATPAGTSYSDFGVTIRGTNSLSSPAMTTIKASGGDGVRRFVLFRSPTAFNIVQNLLFDATDKTGDVNVYSAVRFRDNGQGPIKVQYCQMLGAGTGVMPSGSRFLFIINSTASSTDQGSVEHCYTQNCSRPISGGFGGALLKFKLDNCVFINDSGTANSGAYFAQGAYTIDDASSNCRMTDCTVYEAAGSDLAQEVFDLQPAVGIDIGTVDVYNNLIFLNTTRASPATNPLIGGAVTSTGVTHAGTLGYNVFVYGPDMVLADLPAARTYQLPWDPDDDDSAPDDDDLYATDNRVFETADTVVFNDPSSTFAWTLPNSLTITILKDLRPILYTVAGLSGTTPGALPPQATDLAVVITSSVNSPRAGETIKTTVTLTNTGEDATTIVIAYAVPSNAALVDSQASTGAYIDGVWTVASLSDGATATLDVWMQIGIDEGGNNLSLSTIITSFATPTADSDESNNTDTLVLAAQPDDPTDPENPAAVPFLDVLPIYADDLTLASNIRISTTRNRVRENFIGNDIEGRRWREFMTRLIEVGTNLTTTVNLGGIARGDFLIMESTAGVQLSVGNTTNIFYPAAKTIVLVDGDFDTVQIKNTSTTVSATVLIAVVD